MSDVVASLKYYLYGEDKSASKTITGVGDATEKTGNKLGKFAGMAAGAFAAVGVAKFAKDSISAYGQVAGETAKLQRYIGGTAEDASRLRFAAQQSGVGVDDLANGLGKMSKSMAGGGKAFKALGVDVLDGNGKMKSVNAVFQETSDKLAKMPAGAAKTAAILAIFGKAGMGLGPMLNKGAAGISELEKQSDKLGTTMTTKDLAATKANTVAKRQFTAAITGLQISLGRALYPALTLISTTLAKLAPQIGPVLIPMFALLGQAIMQVVTVVKMFLPVIIAVAGWLARHPALIQAIVIAVVAIVAGLKAWALITKAMTIAQTALNLVMSMNPIGLVVLAIVALIAIFVLCYAKVSWFRAGVTAAFTAIKTAVLAVINWLRANWPLLVAILAGPIGLAVLLIVRHWSTIKQGFLDVKNTVGRGVGEIVGFFTGMPGRIARVASGMFHGVTDAFRTAVNAIISGWNSLRFSINIPSVHIPGTDSHIGGGSVGFGVPAIPFLAKGGIAKRATLAMVGEGSEPEAIAPLSQLRSMLGLAGHGAQPRTVNLHVNGQVYGSVDDLARVLLAGLQRIKGQGIALGLA